MLSYFFQFLYSSGPKDHFICFTLRHGSPLLLVGIDSAYYLKEIRNQGRDERILQFVDYNQAFDNIIDDILAGGEGLDRREKERERK